MPKKTALTASSKAFDPHLEALFASSSGPVQAPPKSRYSELKRSKQEAQEAEGSGDDEVLSEASQELDYDDDENDSDEDDENSFEDDNDDKSSSGEDAGSTADGDEPQEAVKIDEPRRDRKRKRKEENEDLEEKYLAGLNKDDEAEPQEKRVKAENDRKDDEEEEEEEEDEDEQMPTHESLDKTVKAEEADKAARTVFLANVSTEAISSKAAKKTLVKHLSSALDTEGSPIQKLESIRFRSTAFSTGSMPKRAAYITKALMDSTSHSTNAYAVFSTAAAARRVCTQLNGTEVLGRHIRVDNVAHPSPTDHRRCVFVGNLGFVDDETVLNTNEEGEKEAKKRNKVPADVEEGLWRTFSKHGKVESVRVVRDSKTRVGKGFAYVQFYDANDVEAALLLNEKKFPPMLPRKLRVTRAKDPRKTTQAIERSKAKALDDGPSSKRNSNSIYNPKMTPEQKSAAGRARKLFGRKQGGGGNTLPNGFKGPEKIVFEGRRASSRDALPKDLKAKKKNKAKKGRPTNRGARRAAAWQKKSAA